jgi:hypothetical protein
MPAESRHDRPRSYQKSGVYTLKRAVRDLVSRALPSSRTALGRALREWSDSLIADLGGPDAVSTQQLALVDMAVRSKLLVDSVDAYVLEMESPVAVPVSGRQGAPRTDHAVAEPAARPRPRTSDRHGARPHRLPGGEVRRSVARR